MSTDNIIEKIFSDTLKTLSDLIAFKTVSGESNIELIDYCEKKLSKLGTTFVRTYDEENKTIYEFHGDYWHGNPKEYNPDKINSTSKKSFGELFKKTSSS